MKKITFHLFFGLLFLSGIAQAQTTPAEFTWVGSSSTKFDTNDNWAGEQAPSLNANVSIKFSPNAQKDLELTGSTTITDLTNHTNKSLIMAGNDLTILGTINVDGTGKIKTSQSGSLIMMGNSPQEIYGKAFYNNTVTNLTINTNNVSIESDPSGPSPNANDTLKIRGTLTLQKGTLTTNDFLTFRSTQNDDGTLAEIQNGSISGNVTVERYMSANRGYRLVSSPVTTSGSIQDNWQEGVHNTSLDYANNQNPNPHFGTHITGPSTADGFDKSPQNNYSLFTYDDNSGNPYPYSGVTNTNSTTLTAGDAYLLFVRGSRAVNLNIYPATTPTDTTIIRTTGTLKTGSVTENITNTGDYALFGNPYQSAVDMKSVASRSSNVNINANYLYIYDITMGSTGGYRTVDLSTGNSTPPNRQFLQPGQGALLATTTPGAPATINFKEEDKDNGNHYKVFSQEGTSPAPQLIGELYTTKNYTAEANFNDTFTIDFKDNYDNGINALDALKPANIRSENMGIATEGKVYSIEKRAMPKNEERIQLYNNSYTTTNYTLMLRVKNMEGYTPYLKDHFTGKDIMLDKKENTYAFSVDPDEDGSMANDRFSIHFETTLGIDSQNENTGLSIYPNPVQRGNDLFVTASTLKGEKVHVSVTDMLGKTVYHATPTLSTNRIRINTGSFQPGVYFVSLASHGQKVTKKLIVQ